MKVRSKKKAKAQKKSIFEKTVDFFSEDEEHGKYREEREREEWAEQKIFNLRIFEFEALIKKTVKKAVKEALKNKNS